MTPRQLLFLGAVALASLVAAVVTGPLLLNGLLDDAPASADPVPSTPPADAPHPAAAP